MITKFLQLASKSYYDGKPIITDAEFDHLASAYNFDEVGATPICDTVRHTNRMYSLQKVFEGEKQPPIDITKCVETPKLDGAAISLEYVTGVLVSASTRGDGIDGQDITARVLGSALVPLHIPLLEHTQIIGEVVAPKTIENARNYASGALMLKDQAEFNSRDITFVAYGMFTSKNTIFSRYSESLSFLRDISFHTVMFGPVLDGLFPTDGIVYRLEDNLQFDKLGYTSKHPRGAFALKNREDIDVIPTTLNSVTWQVGAGGKVTPVAHFDTVNIEDADINKATLHNVGFVETLDLHIGDKLLVTRAGGVIPKVIGKE